MDKKERLEILRKLDEFLPGVFSAVSVNLPYSDVLELLDILDELTDPATIAVVREGREAIKAGTEGIPVSNLFNGS